MSPVSPVFHIVVTVNKQQNWLPMAEQIYWLIQNLLKIDISNLNGSVKWIVNTIYQGVHITYFNCRYPLTGPQIDSGSHVLKKGPVFNPSQLHLLCELSSHKSKL